MRSVLVVSCQTVMATTIDLTHDGTLLVAMESTACDPHHTALPELSGLSSITSQVGRYPKTSFSCSSSGEFTLCGCSQNESVDGCEQQLRVFLRVRPFNKEELNNNEDQVCVYWP